MAEHFKDARYHLKQAGKHVVGGVRTAVEPVLQRGRAVVGREPEPEPTRRERIEQKAREVNRQVRERVGNLRGRRETKTTEA